MRNRFPLSFSPFESYLFQQPASLPPLFNSLRWASEASEACAAGKYVRTRCGRKAWREGEEGLCSTLFAFLDRSFLSAEEDAALETRQNNSFRFFCTRKENSRPSFLEILLRQNVASQKRGGGEKKDPGTQKCETKRAPRWVE